LPHPLRHRRSPHAQPDRLIERIDDFSLNGHVMWDKLSAHAFVLEVIVEALGETRGPSSSSL
jgi:hypothetical protein